MLNATGERQTGETLDQIKPDHLKRYEWLADILAEEGESSILDAACGAGYGSLVLATKKHVVTGVDISEDAIKHACEYFSTDRTTYQMMDLMTGAFPEGQYDVVVSFETIEHVEDPKTLLERFSEVSDQLVLSVPNEEVLPFNKVDFPFHHRHYTPDQVEELLYSAGWEVIGFYTQYDKWEGTVTEGDDGRTLIVTAVPV